MLLCSREWLVGVPCVVLIGTLSLLPTHSSQEASENPNQPPADQTHTRVLSVLFDYAETWGVRAQPPKAPFRKRLLEIRGVWAAKLKQHINLRTHRFEGILILAQTGRRRGVGEGRMSQRFHPSEGAA